MTYPRDEPAPEAPITVPTIADPASFEAVDESLFDPVRDALRRSDWLAATLALPVVAPGPRPDTATGDETPRWIDYYRARIALLRGDLRAHGEGMTALLGTALSPALEREVLTHLLAVAVLRDDPAEQLRLAQRLASRGDTGACAPSACDEVTWHAAQQLAMTAGTRQVDGGSDEGRGWISLARAAQAGSAPAVAAAVGAWIDDHPQHPAGPRASLLQSGALRDAQTAQVALLLPLSGPLSAASDAVTRGFVAAYIARGDGQTGIEVIDSRRFDDTRASLDAARAAGAGVVVGPLGKLQVAELLAAPPPDMPVLALNRPEVPAAAATVLQLSLAPEDEAIQLAEQVFVRGARRALLVRPGDTWGDRIESALRGRWEALGGHIGATAAYGAPEGYSNTIRDALALDASQQRAAALRSLFTETVETSGRRRGDLDVIFLLTRSAAEARALKPLVDYHYAGDLPVYALSTADGGGLDPGRDRDLEGLRLLVMPWRLQRGSVPGLATEGSAGSFDALHALGADAYDLGRRWWQVHSAATPIVAGFTADLRSDAEGVLLRRLRMAEFNRGALRPL